MKPTQIIFGNYGNHTIALMQWAYEQQLENLTVVSIDTQWAAAEWQERTIQGEILAKSLGFQAIRLPAKPTFQNLMRDRKEFPTQKFKWCAGFLKILPLLNWLDIEDPQCETVVIMGKRRKDSRANHDLPEFIAEYDHFGMRKVWYPLYNCEDKKFHDLIQHAGFRFLPHRSLECDPCVYNTYADFQRMTENTIAKTESLENEMGKTMFVQPIRDMVQSARASDSVKPQNSHELFDMGCGSSFACGE